MAVQEGTLPALDMTEKQQPSCNGTLCDDDVPQENQYFAVAVDHPPPLSSQLSPAELVAKARAPVKREFLRPVGVRVFASKADSAASARLASSGEVEADSIRTEAGGPKISSTKKSKRQQKRERLQARKSAENICAAVARTADANACPYGEECRFNHDLAAFLAQKPPDLPGECPFLIMKNFCPFGEACRFAGTHKKDTCMDVVCFKGGQSNEVNALRKDFQKLLWKNAVFFPKADAQLQLLGVLGKAKQKTPRLPLSGKAQLKMDAGTFDQSLSRGKEIDSAEQDESKVSAETRHLTKSFEGEIKASREEKREVEAPHSKKSKTDMEDNLPFLGPTIESKLGTSDILASSQRCTEMPSSGDDKECRLVGREKKIIDFRGKIYVAPLTTVGNLPFRRVCKQLGADITCGEMAVCTNLLQGQASEWALLRRHCVEDVFGVQICGAHPDTVARTAEIIDQECEVSFIDVNVGCPIDLIVNKGAGSCLLTKPGRLQQIIKAASASIEHPLTLKVRTGYFEGKNCIHTFIPDVHNWGAHAITIHGRTRQQRYSKLADWKYIYENSYLAPDCLQVIGNGDIFSYTDWNEHLNASKLSTIMLARGVLIKPWLLTEIKEQRHWDITANERLDILKDYIRFGLEHWGSDSKGVETTRHFLLEWLSYMHQYVPVGLLEILPQKLNWRPPLYYGRNELETLMGSDSAADWVHISEMLLGPPPTNFVFTPRHKSNAYDKAENG